MLKKQNFSYHNHTYRCLHANGGEKEMIESAIEEGYTYFGLADHAPLEGYIIRGDRMTCLEKDDYLRICNELKETYKDKAEISVGFEVEYDVNRLEEIKNLRNSCDYLLLGQHNKTTTLEYNEEYTYYTSDEDVIMYANQVCEALRTGLFAVLNHPDYFMLGRKCWNDACDQAAHMIAKCASECNIPLEINLKGVRKSKQKYKDGTYYPYPYRKFWEIASEYDVRVILGHDAHHPLDYIREEEIDIVNEILAGIELKQDLNFRIK